MKTKQHIIDTNAEPYIPYETWTVEEHIKDGDFKWKPEEVTLFLSKEQKKGYVEGNILRKEIKNPLNANVLDYLLKNPQLIPEDWKKDASGNTRYIFFWGTIYRDSDGGLCVRYLCWNGGGWVWGCYWRDSGFSGDNPAALRASSTQSSVTKYSALSPLALIAEIEERLEILKKLV